MEGAEGSCSKSLCELYQRIRAGGELQVSEFTLIPSGLSGQDLFASHSFQILPGFLITVCKCLHQSKPFLGGE